MPHPQLPLPGRGFRIMGVVNLTPDSFSDGGRYLCPQEACDHAARLVSAGADLIDLGAESTRPGADEVSSAQEWQRLAPVLDYLSKHLPPTVGLSVDTRKPELMLRAADLGARWINDISGTADSATLETLARYPELAYIAMHSHGTPATMQRQPLGADEALSEVAAFFSAAHQRLLSCGFAAERIYVDPGIGFGKTDRANLHLMAATAEFARSYQLLVGVSRKSWIGRLLGISAPSERDSPSKIAEFALALAGAQIVRTHEVARLAHLRAVFTKAEA